MTTKARAILAVFALTILLLSITIYAADATGPEPAPWWMRVEDAQNLAIKWMGALTIIFGALATLVAFIIGKVNELKERVEKQGNRVDSQQQQITSIALAAPTPGVPMEVKAPPGEPLAVQETPSPLLKNPPFQGPNKP